MSTLLIKNASFVATMDKNENELKNVSIYCENGVIKELGDCKNIVKNIFEEIFIVLTKSIHSSLSEIFVLQKNTSPTFLKIINAIKPNTKYGKILTIEYF